MITVFNRAILFKDPDPQAAARVWSVLKKAGIRYKVKFETSGPTTPAVSVPRTGRTGNIGGGFSGGEYMAGGIPHSWSEGGSSKTLYKIYVSKKDLKKAKEICGID